MLINTHIVYIIVITNSNVTVNNFLLIKVSLDLLCNIMGSNGDTGQWSSDGIIQDDDPTPPVICRSSHLTSFSVLVTSVDTTEVCLHAAS